MNILKGDLADILGEPKPVMLMYVFCECSASCEVARVDPTNCSCAEHTCSKPNELRTVIIFSKLHNFLLAYFDPTYMLCLIMLINNIQGDITDL